ncbi:protein lev-9-like [Porites lutea]|uniref:protein lev-9-like n=1 Tax=Porites lutea TaxID=51062 RepID=UPI003CC58F26
MACGIISASKGQSNCVRTNRSPVTKCTKECEPSVGCDESEEKCLCDGDCGYSCVRKDLSCGSPPPVSKATPNYPSTNFSAVVTYVCNQGYTLSGASTRTCRAIGGWDGVGPSCLQVCTVPDIPFSMHISIPENYERTYKTGETITLACKKGFKEKPGGNGVRICISGRWAQFPFECEGTHACKRTVRAPLTKCTEECAPESGCRSSNDLCLCDGTCGYSCVEKDMSCGNPPAITNGKMTFNGTKYNSTAHYTCNEGYSLNTIFPVKRCTAKKRWSGITPTCMKDCSAPAIPRNANISNPSDRYNSGYKVTFKCNEGYNEEGIATQMCFQGKWTVLPFKCSVGGCGDPGTPKNGRKVGVTYSVNSKVYFGCELGYELMGSEDRKCQPNGSWTGQQPVCTIVDCGLPPRPMNGWFSGNQTKFRSVIKFKCNNGYNLVGSETRICTSDKKWGGREAKCEAVDCGQISAPVNGSITGDKSTYPNYVDIYCGQGFILRGSHRRKCQANGQWNGTEASCVGNKPEYHNNLLHHLEP